MKNFIVYILLLTSTFLFGQSSYNIQFQDEVVKIEENINAFQWDKMPDASKFKNGYYGWIQFYETPNQDIQDDFKRQGLELIEYLPNKAYLFYFSENTSIQYLKDNGVRAIVPIEGQYKLSSKLKEPSYPDYALKKDHVLVMLKFHKHANSAEVIRELEKQEVTVQQEFKIYNTFELAIPISSITSIANLPFVKWMELISPPADNYDNQGRGLQRANNLDTQMPNGRNYTGEGIGVLVRDNGIIGEIDGPHIDFQGRITELTSWNDPDLNFHSDAVAGIFAGAGNLDPRVRGMAAGADIYNVNLGSSFMDTPTTTLLNSGEVQITNTSSGSPCQNGYTLNAVTVDQQAKDIPTLLHVLSAGNVSSTEDCGYGAGPGWGTLGGANKTGKNMIAAGNTRYSGLIVPSSAKGPAADGRIKPDLSAMGAGQVSTDENNQYFTFSGTSASSPAIAGVAAQLYQAYSDNNGGNLPPSALIKAAMLNTANEVGNIGPDYTYGWGLVNGLRAVKVIEEATYLSAEIAQGITNNHVINVPDGATQVNFMVYWSDVPGAIGANPALVNDLDLVVNDPANNSFLPWILDPTPDPIALNTPATNGPDHLNNMEQVQINNPTAGDYTLDISGFNIPIGPQEYFIIYEIIVNNINVTYPNGGEHFVSGESEILHWDAINTTEDFNLEYSTDNGVSWSTIATVPSNTTNYDWDIPFSLKGAALVRVSSGSFTDTSDGLFSLSEQVQSFSFSQVCPDEITFSWNALADAESYDIYVLGEKYMEVVGNTTTTSFSIPITDPTIRLWAAIVAKNETENWASRRTRAIRNSGNVLNCPLSNDLTLFDIMNNPSDFSTPCSDLENTPVSIIIRNAGTEAQSNFEVSYQLNDGDIVTEMYTETIMPAAFGTYDFLTPLMIPGTDDYTITVKINLIGDQNIFNDEDSLSFFAVSNPSELDFVEDFEDDLEAPLGWIIVNPDEELTWTFLDGIIGSDGNSTNTAYLNNWDYDGEGAQDFLVTEFFDLTDENSGAVLNFDLAKAQWNSGLQDGLRVEVSVNCEGNFTTIYEKDDLELSTLPNYNTTDNWQPLNAGHWRTEEIDLTPYLGQIIQFRFVNISGFGNSTYIDNINLNQTLVGIEESISSKIEIFPNPASETIILTWDNQFETEDASIVITNNLGQTISKQTFSSNSNLVIDVSDYVTGLYFVTISSKDVSATKKLIIE